MHIKDYKPKGYINYRKAIVFLSAHKVFIIFGFWFLILYSLYNPKLAVFGWILYIGTQYMLTNLGFIQKAEKIIDNFSGWEYERITILPVYNFLIGKSDLNLNNFSEIQLMSIKTFVWSIDPKVIGLNKKNYLKLRMELNDVEAD